MNTPTPSRRGFGLQLAACALAGPAWSAGEDEGPVAGKRVFWVESYHPGYPWTDGVERGLRAALAKSDVKLEVFRLDAKRRSDDELTTAGQVAYQRIRAFRPDVIVASDDPAQAYVVLPHLVGKGTPVVFVGVNWDAKPYGYPRPGITGMVEVDGIETLLRHLASVARGKRVGFIGSDDISEDKIIAHYRGKRHLFAVEPVVVKVRSYAEYQRQFLQLQAEVDAVVLLNSTTLPGWQAARAREWILAHTRVVTGTANQWMTDLALISLVKLPEEQGDYAAKTALRILRGESPDSIPVVHNEQSRLHLNNALADKLGVVFPLSLLRAATSGKPP